MSQSKQPSAGKCDFSTGPFGIRKCGKRASVEVVAKSTGRVAAKRCELHAAHLNKSVAYTFRPVSSSHSAEISESPDAHR